MKKIIIDDGSFEKLSVLRTTLLKAIEKNQPITIDLEDHEHFDVSLIQLFYGLDKSAAKKHIQIKLWGKGIQRLEKIRTFAGLPQFTTLDISQ
jgi:anti-anti-sigma regulatory factor